MNIAETSMYLSQSSVQNAASISVLKMAMNTSTETGTHITDMMNNMAVDTTRGTVIDATV